MGLNQLRIDTYKYKKDICQLNFTVENESFTPRIKTSNKEFLKHQYSRQSISEISQRHSRRNVYFPLEIGIRVGQPVVMGMAASAAKRREEIKFPVLVQSIDVNRNQKRMEVVTTSSLVTSSSTPGSTWRDLEEAEGIYHTTVTNGDDTEYIVFPPKYDNIIESIEAESKPHKSSLFKFTKSKSETIGVNLNVSGSKAKCAYRTPAKIKYRAVTTDNTKRRRNSKAKVNREDCMKSLDQRLETARSKTRPKTATSSRDQNKKPIRAFIPKVNPSIFSCINPNNLQDEKDKFFKSNFEYNPQFKYTNPLSSAMIQRFNNPSNKYINEVNSK